MCRRRAIGNAHQRADQTKPKGKYTIQDVEKILEKMENAERSIWTSMRERCLSLVVFLLYASFLRTKNRVLCSLASI